MVISHLNDYFEKNNDQFLKNDKYNLIKLTIAMKLVNKIIEVLDTKIRPAVARDGGDIKFKSFENGVVKVELQGSCSGCPSSLMTLKQGVQNLLKHYVKEVNSVEAYSYEKKIKLSEINYLELAYIYSVKEIQEYVKNRKNLNYRSIRTYFKKK